MTLTRRALGCLGASMWLGWHGRTALAATNLQANRILILIELNGGNDGLNSVIPYRQDRYFRDFRRSIAIAGDRLITLDDSTAFHPALEPILPAFADGSAGLIHNIGYTKPNRSHFASMAIWHGGADGRQSEDQGWVAQTYDAHAKAHEFDVLGASLDGALGPMKGGQGLFVDLTDVGRLQEITSIDAAATSHNPLLQIIEAKRQLYNDAVATISRRLARNPLPRDVLDKLPRSRLGGQARQAIRLIAAGVKVPVIKLMLDGFDTHAWQADRHVRLLADLALTMAGLRDALITLGRYDDVVMLTYSEFGRTLQENASGGTDHGAGAPHWIMGGRVRGGMYGNMPDLEQQPGDGFAHEIDYRSVFAAVLEQHLLIADHKFGDQRMSQFNRLINT